MDLYTNNELLVQHTRVLFCNVINMPHMGLEQTPYNCLNKPHKGRKYSYAGIAECHTQIAETQTKVVLSQVFTTGNVYKTLSYVGLSM